MTETELNLLKFLVSRRFHLNKFGMYRCSFQIKNIKTYIFRTPAWHGNLFFLQRCHVDPIWFHVCLLARLFPTLDWATQSNYFEVRMDQQDSQHVLELWKALVGGKTFGWRFAMIWDDLRCHVNSNNHIPYLGHWLVRSSKRNRWLKKTRKKSHFFQFTPWDWWISPGDILF